MINNKKPIKIERIWAMPNKNTFIVKPIAQLISEEVDLSKKWIDPFANQNKIATITNDLNPMYDTDYHMDALDFMKMFDDGSIDGVLYDPPYSPRQVSECYNDVGYSVTWDTTKASFWGNHKREISRIVKLGGKVITFGWNSGGIGYKYGFEIERILLVPHGGWHNDTICTVEIKTHEGCFNKEKCVESKFDKEKTMTENDKKLIKKIESLPSNYWDFKNDDTKEYTHGIHNYPAMMVSPISRNIIKMIRDIQPVKALLDPFAGSGTVLVEGMLSGIDMVAGNDINPLALLISKVKVTPLNSKELENVVDKLLHDISLQRLKYKEKIDKINEYMENILGLDLTDKKGWGDKAHEYVSEFFEKEKIDYDVPCFKNMGYWFKPYVIFELIIIRSEIKKINNTDIKDFLFVALSESIRLVSNRRNGEFKMFRMQANKVASFSPDVYIEFSKILKRNTTKMKEFCDRLSDNIVKSRVSIYENSTCELDDVPNNTFDLVVTSPPYGDSKTTVAYGEYSRLSLQWIDQFNLSDKEIMSVDKSLMGGKKYRNGFEYLIDSKTLREELDRIIEVDVERAGDVYSFYEDLDLALKKVADKTVSGGYQFWVVGNRTVKNILLQTDVIISEIAPKYNLTHIYTIDRNIPNKVMPSLNSPSNISGDKCSTMTMEHIVVLRKNNN